MIGSQVPNYRQWLKIRDCLETVFELRKRGKSGGYAALIFTLNQIGYFPANSHEAERIAKIVIDGGYQKEPNERD